MKKLTCMLMALVAGFGAMQMSAQVDAVTAEKVKAGMAAKSAAIHPYLPSGYQQLGDTKIYYHIGYHDAANFNYYTIDILGEINGSYYSSTYNDSGYLGAFSVDGGTAEYLDCVNGTTISGVKARYYYQRSDLNSMGISGDTNYEIIETLKSWGISVMNVN